MAGTYDDVGQMICVEIMVPAAQARLIGLSSLGLVVVVTSRERP